MIQKNFLAEQYNQCNDNLRDTDRKRDVMLGFYAAFSAALYGFAAKPETQNLFSLGLVFLVIFGIGLGLLFTIYRAWHNVYVLQAIVLQRLAHEEEGMSISELVKSADFKFNNFLATELLMFFLLQAVLLMNIIATFIVLESFPAQCIAFILFVCFVVEFLVHFGVMMWFDGLKKHKKLGTKYLWILQGTEARQQEKP